MPYQNDMATLADVVSPVDAAVQAGIQNQQENLKQQMANQVYQQQMPALAAEPGLKNLYQQQLTATQQGLAQQQQAKGQYEQATLPSETAAGIAGNQVKLTSAQNQKLGQLGQMAGNLAGIMDGVPAEQRPQAMAAYLQSHDIDPREVPSPIMSGDPDMLRNISQKMIKSSAEFQMMQAKETIAGQTARDVATTQGQAHLGGVAMTAAGRLEGQRIMAQMRQQQQTFEQAAVQAEKSGNHALATQYTQAALQMRQAQAGISSQLVLGQPLQTPFGGGQVPAAAGGGQPLSTDAVEAAAKNTFGAYEPDKYEYGVNPQTGNFARRPK